MTMRSAMRRISGSVQISLSIIYINYMCICTSEYVFCTFVCVLVYVFNCAFLPVWLYTRMHTQADTQEEKKYECVYVFVRVCLHTRSGMSICLCLEISVCMYAYMYVCMVVNLPVYGRENAFVYIYYIYIYIYIYVRTHTRTYMWGYGMYVYVCVCISRFACVCIFVSFPSTWLHLFVTVSPSDTCLLMIISLSASLSVCLSVCLSVRRLLPICIHSQISSSSLKQPNNVPVHLDNASISFPKFSWEVAYLPGWKVLFTFHPPKPMGKKKEPFILTKFFLNEILIITIL